MQIAEGALKARVTMPLTKRDPNNHTHFVIIGGGAAGLNAAETLRQSGFTGQITLLTNENRISSPWSEIKSLDNALSSLLDRLGT